MTASEKHLSLKLHGRNCGYFMTEFETAFRLNQKSLAVETLDKSG